MFTRDDLIDAIVRHLASSAAVMPDNSANTRPSSPGALPAVQSSAVAAAPAKPAAAPSHNKLSPHGPKGKLFLSEFDIKKRLTAGSKRLTLPPDAIVSPLAHDWIVLEGIEIVRE